LALFTVRTYPGQPHDLGISKVKFQFNVLRKKTVRKLNKVKFQGFFGDSLQAEFSRVAPEAVETARESR
jgi:hypothetical protein